MMFTYKEDLFEKKKDKDILNIIKTKKQELEIGPKAVNIDGKHKNMKGTMLISSSSAYSSKYEWSKEISKLKEHFQLELDVLEQLFKGKNAALRQDHLTSCICMFNAKEFFKARNTDFYDKTLREVHNDVNNLWKWILNLHFVLVSRNRLLLNTYFTNVEKFVEQNSKNVMA